MNDNERGPVDGSYDSPPPQAHEAKRTEINNQVEEFLAKGGTVQELDYKTLTPSQLLDRKTKKVYGNPRAKKDEGTI